MGQLIMHIDMDSYFASVEQQANPSLFLPLPWWERAGVRGKQGGHPIPLPWPLPRWGNELAALRVRVKGAWSAHLSRPQPAKPLSQWQGAFLVGDQPGEQRSSEFSGGGFGVRPFALLFLISP